MSDTSLAGQHELAEYVDGLPNLSGGEPLIAASIADAAERAVFAHAGLRGIRSRESTARSRSRCTCTSR